MTDELDRRVLASYLNQFYCEEALSTPNYPLSPLPIYYIPDTNTLSGWKDYVSTLPTYDRPEAFGQHPNADISYQIEDSRVVLDSLLSLQPTTPGRRRRPLGREIVTTIANDILDQVSPPPPPPPPTALPGSPALWRGSARCMSPPPSPIHLIFSHTSSAVSFYRPWQGLRVTPSSDGPPPPTLPCRTVHDRCPGLSTSRR